MTFESHARRLLIDYRKAHLTWKFAPDGPEKVTAQQAKKKLHSKILELAELCERQGKER